MREARGLLDSSALLLGACACMLATACAQTVPTQLYSGERRPRSAVATIRASGIHRLEKVDRRVVKGQLFAVEPGRHRLEFYSRSEGSVHGLGIPYFGVRCRVELEMEAGHRYELEGEIESTSPDPSHFDGLTWRLHSLEGRLVDETTGATVDGLVCPHSCRAVAHSGSTYKWMPCAKYRELVSNPPAADAEGTRP